jgi:peptide maturation system protein (TIGR04066 family)
MANSAFFPTNVETLPFVTCLKEDDSRYSIKRLLTIPGTSLVGKDLSYADNRNITGITVDGNVTTACDDWDTMLVADYMGINTDEMVRHQILSEIEKAIELRKAIICDLTLCGNEKDRLTDLAHKHDTTFTYLPQDIQIPDGKPASLFVPSPLVIFIGGLIRETNCFEAFLSMTKKLRSKFNLKVLSFTTQSNCNFCNVINISPLLYSRGHTEIEKIYSLNEIIRLNCNKVNPDVIIIHIAEPLIEYNSSIPNGFGIYPYIISRALVPDYFICGIPYLFGYPEYIDALSEGIRGRFGFAVDFVHLGNAELDTSYVSSAQKISVIYNTYDIVEKQRKTYCENAEIPVCNLLSGDSLDNLVSELAELICDSKTIFPIKV